MENQHRKIAGYRELDQAEIDLMNEIKAEGVRLKELHDKALAFINSDLRLNPNERRRWLAIGRTDYQKGLMALTRAIAAPDFE